ncbi:vacuolar protein 8 [Chrysochromulina tobinii]|uniref:Vacuolar protein 8 n=1 Tax=Chrysochromulina tobinii TaxID=1460289 RepID=A0A0M0JPU4_9EUKA|nr:vacuolar protein 8 [Chrysochromulina tobinii]|eukprot:KOO28606.1 vacuolar protein 8 [Chrysochromulina sp. CCMP291]
MIAQAGGIKPLVALLKEGSANGQRDACGALANIARGRTEYQQKVVDAGGVTSMAALLRNGDASAAEQAAAGLASISQCVGAQKLIISSGAVPPLVNLLKVNQRFEAQIRAAEALANLAQNSDEGCEAVAKAGAIPRILELLGTGKAMEACSRALAKLAHSNVNNQNEICKLGGIAKLLPPLSGVNVEAQVAAASALAELASGERCPLVKHNEKNQDKAMDQGAISLLVSLIRQTTTPSVEAEVAGVESAKAFALWSLSLCITDENRQVMIEAGVMDRSLIC